MPTRERRALGATGRRWRFRAKPYAAGTCSAPSYCLKRTFLPPQWFEEVLACEAFARGDTCASTKLSWFSVLLAGIAAVAHTAIAEEYRGTLAQRLACTPDVLRPRGTAGARRRPHCRVSASERDATRRVMQSGVRVEMPKRPAVTSRRKQPEARSGRTAGSKSLAERRLDLLVVHPRGSDRDNQ